MVSPQVSLTSAGQTRPGFEVAKAVVDSVAGILGSTITVLITPVIGLLIKLEDTGPIFYRREYVDRHGRKRYYLKFRTMVRNANDLLENDPELRRRFSERQKLEHDPRILRIGRVLRKFSIDEFPQFFSILTGDLTLVGPRVVQGEETAHYGELLPKLLSVKPGITGYWQVNGRSNISYQERVRMDMYYVDNRSVRLDLQIIAKTFWTVFRGEGAY